MNFLDNFDGLMLSDGSITKDKEHKNYRYTQVCKRKEWLDYISFLFSEYGFNSSITTSNRFIWNSNFTIYNLQSNRSLYFTDQHKRWYIKDYNVDEYPTRLWHLDKEKDEWFAWHKTIPKDVTLTPECVLNWYLGDGTLCQNRLIRISTDGFTKTEVENLAFLLNEQVIEKACISKEKNKLKNIYAYNIDINKRECRKSFFDYIKDCEIPSCYSYKFPKELLN